MKGTSRIKPGKCGEKRGKYEQMMIMREDKDRKQARATSTKSKNKDV
jgi:hypothetical protein